MLRAPGECGADICVGEGQALAVPPQYGGPGVGLFGASQAFVRQMPGRLVGRTVDAEGHPGFVLTLSTREQHIRREKATSNICSNQGVCAMMAGMFMATLGGTGLRELARLDHQGLVAVLRVLVQQYEQLAEPDRAAQCQCLIFLGRPRAVADVLLGAVPDFDTEIPSGSHQHTGNQQRQYSRQKPMVPHVTEPPRLRVESSGPPACRVLWSGLRGC